MTQKHRDTCSLTVIQVSSIIVEKNTLFLLIEFAECPGQTVHAFHLKCHEKATWTPCEPAMTVVLEGHVATGSSLTLV